MPTYDYECDSCGHQFEKSQKMSDLPIKECPKCDKKKARRLIGAGAGVIFKGSGFYATDYRKGKTSDAGACPSAKKDSPKCSGCPSGGHNH